MPGAVAPAATGLRPGCPHSRSERDRAGVMRSASPISSRPNSKNCASTAYWKGMSSPSIQAMGAAVALWWACQFQPACGRKSPRRMATGSRPTTVHTPSPSTTKRKACWVWRCSGASSPGMRYWMAAHSVGVAKGLPPRAGLASAMARRSPPRPTGTRSPACSASPRSRSQRQRWGTARERGWAGIRSPISVHSGTSSSCSRPRYSSSSAGVTSGCPCAETAWRRTGDARDGWVDGVVRVDWVTYDSVRRVRQENR